MVVGGGATGSTAERESAGPAHATGFAQSDLVGHLKSGFSFLIDF